MRFLFLILCVCFPYPLLAHPPLLTILTSPIEDPLAVKPPILHSTHLASLYGSLGKCNDNILLKQEISLYLVLDLALCHNPQLHSTWASIKSQTAQLGATKSSYLPTVNLSVTYGNQKTHYSDNKNIDIDKTGDSRYATLTWRLFDFGARDANHRAAIDLLDAAIEGHNALLQKTISTVIGLYFDAKTAKAEEEAKEKNLILAKDTFLLAKRREDKGIGQQSDTLQAKTSLAKAELDKTRSNGNYKKSMVALFVSMGISVPSIALESIPLSPEEDNISLVQIEKELIHWLTIAQHQHPAILAAKARLESAEEKLIVARSEGMPTVDLNINQYINGIPSQGLSSSQMEQSMINLSVNYPLFEGFSRGYKIQDAQAQIDIKRAELKDVEVQILGDIAKAHTDAMSALYNIQSSKILLESAEMALQTIRRKYEKGVSDILEMLNVQVALSDAQQERIRCLAEWQSARLRLLANTGIIDQRDIITHH